MCRSKNVTLLNFNQILLFSFNIQIRYEAVNYGDLVNQRVESLGGFFWGGEVETRSVMAEERGTVELIQYFPLPLLTLQY